MDDRQFDDLIRALQRSGSRRGALTAILTGIGVPLFAGPDAEADRGKGKRKRKRHGKHKSKRHKKSRRKVNKQGKDKDKGKDKEKNKDNVTICHKPGTPAEHTLVVAQSAVNAHLGHGDYLGACQAQATTPPPVTTPPPGTTTAPPPTTTQPPCDPNACPTPSNQCREAFCNDRGSCDERPKADGTSCDDGNACTQTDTCQAGACQGSNPVACTASDQCHDAGTCDPATGQCSNPAKPDGSTCDDGNACTQTDTCQNGACVGSNPVVCTSLDQCHEPGTCDPQTGTCSNPEKPDGTSCDDGNACTLNDTCQAGTCTGSASVVCTALDQCHDVGTCDPATGQCSNPEKPDGTTCDDGNACTQTDTCQAGACQGSNPVVCTAQDQCHEAGTCDPRTGICSNPQKPNGTSCNDGNACTQTDTCQNGSCVGSNPVVCTALDQCHVAGTCDPATGQCSNPAKPNGTACNDGNVCTVNDMCQAGTCIGATVTCPTGQICCPSGVFAGTCKLPAGGNCAAGGGNAATRDARCCSNDCVGQGNGEICD